MNTHSLESLNVFVSSLIRPTALRLNSDARNAAVVLDDFSMHCFRPEVNLWPLATTAIDLDLDHIRPDYLVVESAWNGNNGLWRYRIAPTKPPHPDLLKLISECRLRGIPTVFWNKEDPVHFHDFKETASHFDYVFTTDADMIERYNGIAPQKPVELLRFAASETLHNPRRVDGYRQGDIAFAGQYFAHKYPERRKQLELLFPEATRHDFSIFSRELGGKEEYQFPSIYQSFIKGSLPYSEMVNEYRRHKIFLNLNSVVNSRTMCARRVFELSAAKTAVVGVYSEAIESVYAQDEIWQVRTASEARHAFETLLTDEWAFRHRVQAAWRRTLAQHTYRNRVAQIHRAIGFTETQQEIEIHMWIDGNDPDRVHATLEMLLDQDFSSLPLNVSLTWDAPAFSQSQCADLQRDFTNVLPFRRAVPPGAYCAYVNPDYRLGQHYLCDLYLALGQQGTDFVTKAPLELRMEHSESLVSSLPNHGWLARPEIHQTAQSLVRSHESLHAEFPVSGHSIYMADPLDIAPIGSANMYLFSK